MRYSSLNVFGDVELLRLIRPSLSITVAVRVRANVINFSLGGNKGEKERERERKLFPSSNRSDDDMCRKRVGWRVIGGSNWMKREEYYVSALLPFAAHHGYAMSMSSCNRA